LTSNQLFQSCRTAVSGSPLLEQLILFLIRPNINELQLSRSPLRLVGMVIFSKRIIGYAVLETDFVVLQGQDRLGPQRRRLLRILLEKQRLPRTVAYLIDDAGLAQAEGVFSLNAHVDLGAGRHLDLFARLEKANRRLAVGCHIYPKSVGI